MRSQRMRAGVGLCLIASLAGCKGFLDSEKAVADPNSPTVATRNQLFIGALANIYGEQEGPVAMIVCEWMQQCAGVGGRFVDTQGKYGISAASFDGSFSSIYDGGGLTQIRAVEATARTDGDKLYLGIAQVIEVMDVLWGADIWGDIPYRSAVGA